MRKNELQYSVNDRAENVEGIDENSDTIKVMCGHINILTYWKKHYETFYSTTLVFVLNKSHSDYNLIQDYCVLNLLTEKNVAAKVIGMENLFFELNFMVLSPRVFFFNFTRESYLII